MRKKYTYICIHMYIYIQQVYTNFVVQFRDCYVTLEYHKLSIIVNPVKRRSNKFSFSTVSDHWERGVSYIGLNRHGKRWLVSSGDSRMWNKCMSGMSGSILNKRCLPYCNIRSVNARGSSSFLCWLLLCDWPLYVTCLCGFRSITMCLQEWLQRKLESRYSLERRLLCCFIGRVLSRGKNGVFSSAMKVAFAISELSQIIKFSKF